MIQYLSRCYCYKIQRGNFFSIKIEKKKKKKKSNVQVVTCGDYSTHQFGNRLKTRKIVLPLQANQTVNLRLGGKVSTSKSNDQYYSQVKIDRALKLVEYCQSFKEIILVNFSLTTKKGKLSNGHQKQYKVVVNKNKK